MSSDASNTSTPSTLTADDILRAIKLLEAEAGRDVPGTLLVPSSMFRRLKEGGHIALDAGHIHEIRIVELPMLPPNLVLPLTADGKPWYNTLQGVKKEDEA